MRNSNNTYCYQYLPANRQTNRTNPTTPTDSGPVRIHQDALERSVIGCWEVFMTCDPRPWNPLPLTSVWACCRTSLWRVPYFSSVHHYFNECVSLHHTFASERRPVRETKETLCTLTENWTRKWTAGNSWTVKSSVSPGPTDGAAGGRLHRQNNNVIVAI